MFLNISWTTYIIFISLLLAVWYIAVGFKFYFPGLKNPFSSNKRFSYKGGDKKSLFNTGAIKDSKLSEVNDNPLINLEETDQLFEVTEELIGKLKNAISNAALKRQNKQEFTLILQVILNEYPILKNSSFHAGINDLIIEECEKYGFITLSAEEVVMLWNKFK